MEIRTLDSSSPDFWSDLERLHGVDIGGADAKIVSTVQEIINDVRMRGDAALLDYTARFDRLTVASAADLEISQERLQAALARTTREQRDTLEFAADRIRRYHEQQKLASWAYLEDDGTVLGQKITPLDRVGLYVPGGKAAYPSSVLMNAIPAKVAGVPELIMTVPTPGGEVNDWVLAAAAIAKVDRVFALGGAQAVAALAYGTATVPSVAKIVGPGNIYVATAKRLVFGAVGIDMIAGPSEILVICDGRTNPDWIAMDLFSQAEHDEDAQSILVSQDADFLKQVHASIDKLLPQMERADIIRKSLQARGLMIKVRNMTEAARVADFIAPEHLELSVEDAEGLANKISHAGAMFMGRYTAEAVGDYCAGPNHVLPTARTARFSSPLGVYDFQKRTSLIMCSPKGASELGKHASAFARGEGLTAHARSAEYRIKPSS